LGLVNCNSQQFSMFSSKKKYVTVKKGQQINIDGQCWKPNYARLGRVLQNILQALRAWEKLPLREEAG